MQGSVEWVCVDAREGKSPALDSFYSSCRKQIPCAGLHYSFLITSLCYSWIH
jgi:hypothetical protein